MKIRRLTAKQQAVAADAMQFVQPAISAFVRKNPDLRRAVRRVDMESVAYHAVCSAAITYKRDKSMPTTYFGSAIRHALYREVLSQQKQDGRYVPVDHIMFPPAEGKVAVRCMRALRALKKLSAMDQMLLEDRLIEQISFEKLGREHGCDPRTIAKRVRQAIDSLRVAEGDIP
jgi:DNA-directed RNA polymerase specialized sigma24 family protein